MQYEGQVGDLEKKVEGLARELAAAREQVGGRVGGWVGQGMRGGRGQWCEH